jgi:hypothetical protein
MRWLRIKMCFSMTFKELIRSRITLLLVFIVPTFFYLIIFLTTPEKPIAFKLASISEDTYVEVNQRNESLIFIGLAACGLLASFIGMNFMQKNTESTRRLILCGYRPSEVIIAKAALLMAVICVISAYVSSMLLLFFTPKYFLLTATGFVLCGAVYGAYGTFVGVVSRRELEGILFIVLLSNIDAAWLQNPIYYADSQNKLIIRCLPAFFPSQLSMVSAFTDKQVHNPLMGSLAYIAFFIGLSLLLYWGKMKSRKKGFV